MMKEKGGWGKEMQGGGRKKGVSRNFRLFPKTDGFLSFLIVSAYILISAAATTSFSHRRACETLT